MKFGQFKIISLVSSSLISKSGDDSQKIVFQLQNGNAFVNVDDANGVLIVRNDTSYLFDVPVTIQSGRFTFDFSNENVSALPSGSYKFQVNLTEDEAVSKYPDDGFVDFSIDKDGRNTVMGLVPEITFNSVLTAVDEKISNYTKTIAKGDTGEKGEKGDPGKKGDPGDKGADGADGLNGKDAISLYKNVLDYGADRNGEVDSTTAFKNAIDYVTNNKNEHALFIPSGTYLINDGLLVNDISIIGQEKNNTIIKTSSAKPVFSIGTQTSMVSNLTVDISGAPDGAIGIELGFSYTPSDGLEHYTSAHYSEVNRLIINDSPSHFFSVGICARPHHEQTPTDLGGVWTNIVSDIIMKNIGIGISLKTSEKGWINANSFRDILIKTFQTYGVSLDSGSNPAGIQHNVFDAIQVEATSGTSSTGIAFNVTAGEYNFFNNCTVWNDDGSGKNGVTGLYIGTSSGYTNYWQVSNNTFKDCVFELPITGTKKALDVNNINSYIMNADATKLVSNQDMKTRYDNSVKNNLIPSSVLENFYRYPEISLLNMSGGTNQLGKDGVSTYLSVSPDNNNKILLQHNLIDRQVTHIASSQALTYSVRFNMSDITTLNLNCNLQMFSNDGSNISVSAETFFTELISNNEYALNAYFDLSSYSDFLKNIKYMNLSIAFGGNIPILFRELKAGSALVNNYNKYNSYFGIPVQSKMTVLPTKWEDMGIFLTATTAFDQGYLDIKKVGTTYYVKVPVLV